MKFMLGGIVIVLMSIFMVCMAIAGSWLDIPAITAVIGLVLFLIGVFRKN